MPAVAQRGWVFLTQDARIRYRAAEIAALRRAGLGVFVLITANLSADGKVPILERARSTMERVAASEPRPFIWRVGKDGSVKPLG